jgi:hypothetical protein
MYELALYAPSTGAQNVQYRVTRLNTGHVAEGTLTGAVGTVLPAASIFLTPWAFRTNNATALAVAIDIVGMYISTDF